MRLTTPDPSLAALGLRAVKTVATARGPLHPTQRSMIDLAQRLTLGTQLDVDGLEPITPESLAASIPTPEGRERVVRGMVLVCLARGEVTKDDAAAIERYARVLGVTEHAVTNVRQLAEGRLALLRYDVNRRAFTGRAVAEARETEGLVALLRAAASRAGFREDAATAAKYEALASYPEHTLGRELWAYYSATTSRFRVVFTPSRRSRPFTISATFSAATASTGPARSRWWPSRRASWSAIP